MQITIPGLKREMLIFTIVGDTDLVINKWSEKAKKEMLDKQQQKAGHKKGKRNPHEEYRSAMYIISDKNEKKERHGIKSIALKNCAVRAATDAGLNMTDMRRAFFVLGEFVEIIFPKETPEMREDNVRLRGTSDLRYRPGYWPWEAVLKIEYNANVISAEQIINLFQLGGFGVGIGEWRPERNGPMGRFHIKEEDKK